MGGLDMPFFTCRRVPVFHKPESSGFSQAGDSRFFTSRRLVFPHRNRKKAFGLENTATAAEAESPYGGSGE